MKKSNKYQADIACCDCIEILEDVIKGNFRNVVKNRTIKVIDEYVEDYIKKEEFYGAVVWGKIIKKELLTDIHFENIKYGEDTKYMYNIFLTNPVTRLNVYKGYYYMRNKDSITYSKRENEIKIYLDRIYAGEAVYGCALECKNKELLKKVIECYEQRIYISIVEMIKENSYEEYIENYKILCKHILKLENNFSKKALLFKFFKCFPYSYWKFFRLYYRIRYRIK